GSGLRRSPGAPSWSRCRRWRQARATWANWTPGPWVASRGEGQQLETFKTLIPTLRRLLHLQGAATARKRRIGHEIGMRGESICVLGMRIADKAPVRLHIPALRLVFQLRHHDLIQHLLMDGGIFNGN